MVLQAKNQNLKHPTPSPLSLEQAKGARELDRKESLMTQFHLTFRFNPEQNTCTIMMFDDDGEQIAEWTKENFAERSDYDFESDQIEGSQRAGETQPCNGDTHWRK